MAITDNPPPILEVEDRPSTGTIAVPPVLDPSDQSHLPPARTYKSEVDGGLPKHVHQLGPDGPPRSIVDHAQFWSTYDRIADSYDKELLDAWNKSLDVLLIFAGLFSAINTAFIIESYKGLQPDPAETTNALLRLSIAHRNDNITLSLEDLIPPAPSAVPINSIFFSSLSFSLTAAFGAVTAKQWLTEYSNVGIMKVLHVQGKRRQEKFNGLKTWHFRIIIELLPILLQISLFLFLIGVVHFLWTINRTVAIGQLVLSAAGVAIYIVTIAIAIFVPTSPFQTPISRHLPRFFDRIRRGFNASIQLFHLSKRLALQWLTPVTSFIDTTGVTDQVTYLREFFATHLSVFIQWIKGTWSLHSSTPEEVQIGRVLWNRDEIVTAEAIVWLLEQAEHPDVTIMALDAVPRLPPDLILSLVQQREGLLERLIRFHNSLIPPRPPSHEGNKWIITFPNRVMVSGVALYHILKSQRFQCRKNDITDSHHSLIQGLSQKDFRSSLADQTEDPIVLMHYLVDLNLCSSISVEFGHIDLLNILQSQSASLGPSPVIQVEPMDARQGSTGNTPVSLILQPELVLDFILRVAWTKPSLIMPYPARIGHQILRPLSVLLQAELSTNLVSHLAITFATVCWSCKRDDPWSYPSIADQSQLELLLMDRCLAVDKSKNLLDNIVLALSMIDVATPDAFKDLLNSSRHVAEPNLAPHILHSLIKIAAPLLEAEFGSIAAGQIPYPNFAECLLRLLKAVGPNIKTTRHEIARLLSYCPTGDWILPTDDKFGDVIVQLLASLFSEDPGRILGNILDKIAQVSNDIQFRAVVESPTYIYPHHRSIPLGQFLCPYQFVERALLLHDQNSAHTSVLLETQISFAQVQLDTYHMVPLVCDFLNRIVQEDSDLHWPAYFLTVGIVSSNTFPNANPPVVLRSIDPDHLRHHIFDAEENRGLKSAWWGEATLMLWRKGKKECVNGKLPSDWNDSLFFGSYGVAVMMTYYQHIRMHAYMGIDWDLVKEYFNRATDAMQGYDFVPAWGRTKERQIRDVEQIVQELSDYSNDHPPPPRGSNST